MPEILRMPEVAANAVEAVLSIWNVGVDAPYSAGDPIVTVETEKAIVDVEAEADGVLLRQLVAEGTNVEVGTPIAVWGAIGESVADVDELLATLGTSIPENSAQPLPLDSQEASDDVLHDRDGQLAAPRRLFASPLARRLARDLEVDLDSVLGSGPRGRIRRRDVEAAAAASSPPDAPAPAVIEPFAVAPAPAGSPRCEDVPNSRMRQAIARRLTDSTQTVPHFYLRGSARVDRLLALRAELNAGSATKVSVNDLMVKAVAAAHARVPAMNVQWNGDSIRHFSGVDVAIAVATDNGLVTPVIRDAHSISLGRLAATTQDLAARARERRLQQSELEGGTISVTNLGRFGTEEFAAIINPPHAAILAVGAARQEPVVDDGEIVVTTVLRVTLAVDHRPVDGATAAQWMAAYVDLVEHPTQILL